jgi:hypothetical protein
MFDSENWFPIAGLKPGKGKRTTATVFLRSPLSPVTQELNMVSHLLHGLGGDELEQSPQLLADRVSLLWPENNPAMRVSQFNNQRVKLVEIPRVATE